MILACLFISMYSSVVLLLHVCVCFGPHGRVSWTQCHLSTWSHRPPPPPPPSYYYRCTSCAADTTIHNSYLYCLWLSDSFSAHLIDVTHIVEVPTRNPEGRSGFIIGLIFGRVPIQKFILETLETLNGAFWPCFARLKLGDAVRTCVASNIYQQINTICMQKKRINRNWLIRFWAIFGDYWGPDSKAKLAIFKIWVF